MLTLEPTDDICLNINGFIAVGSMQERTYADSIEFLLREREEPHQGSTRKFWPPRYTILPRLFICTVKRRTVDTS